MPDTDDTDDTAGTDRRIEVALIDLGRRLDLPSPPDVTAAVLDRLAVPQRRGERVHDRRRRPIRVALVVLLALTVTAAVTPAGQAAVSRVVHAFGVVLQLGAAGSPTTVRPGDPGQPGGSAQLPGQTVLPLDRARDQVHFAVVVPAALGRPDEVSVSDEGRVLSLVYRAGPGRPVAGPGGVSARLDEFDGTLNPVFLKQLPDQARWIDLPGGAYAVWIDGPHTVEYVDAHGVVRPQTARLASRTLVWEVGAVTLRLEGEFTVEQATAIAAATVSPSPEPSSSASPSVSPSASPSP